ncbi:MAG: TonB-dependent receptor [Pseudomonadota bacterium]
MTEPRLHRQLPIALAIVLTVTLGAQDAAAQLDEITVTAERREASIQDVPVAVSAYNEELLENFQIQETLDLINVVPNLFGGNNTGLGTANMYYIRGQGNDESIATFDPPVGTYIDGIYVSRQNANNFALFDVDRIEVLRGPQGTLFGRNTTGGAFNMILRKPSETQSGFAEVQVGRFNERMFRGTIDLPASDNVLTKFSAFYIENDGWLENRNPAVGGDFNEKDALGLRADVRVLAGDDIVWDLAIDYIDDTEGNVLGQIDGDERVSTSILPNGLPAGGLFGFVAPQPVAFTSKGADYGNQVESINVASNLGFPVAGGDAEFIVGYRSMEQKFLINFPQPPNDDFFWIDNDGQHDQLTAELKWNAQFADGNVDFVGGVFILDEDNETDFADYLFGAFVLADRVLDNTTQSWAIYGQADIGIGERGTLTIGARYTDEEKEIGLSDNLPALGRAPEDQLTTAALISAGVPTSQDEQIVTPRIAYAHDFRDGLMGYVSATRGFKSGGWNARGSAPTAFQPFGPETLWAYEAGIRGDFLNDTLRINATAFLTDLEDLQTTSATPSGAFLTTNAGGLDATGLEIEATWVPSANWDVFFAAGFQNVEYTDLPSGCVTPNTDFAAFDINCNVADPKRSPDLTYTLGTTVSIPLASMGATLQPTALMRYIGDNVVGTRQLGENDAEVIVNAGVALIDDDGQWRLTAECNNCSDEEYTTSFLFTPYWTPPMTWSLRFRWNYGGR